MPRNVFYCPSNTRWNRDDFWDWPGGQDTVMGYLYFPGEPNYFNNAALQRVVPPGRNAFALKNTDRPFYTVMFADLMRKLNGPSGWTWGRPGDSDPNMHGANHYGSGATPDGANQGFLDGHAEWMSSTGPWIRFPKLIFSGNQIYFHGGDENP